MSSNKIKVRKESSKDLNKPNKLHVVNDLKKIEINSADDVRNVIKSALRDDRIEVAEDCNRLKKDSECIILYDTKELESCKKVFNEECRLAEDVKHEAITNLPSMRITRSQLKKLKQPLSNKNVHEESNVTKDVKNVSVINVKSTTRRQLKKRPGRPPKAGQAKKTKIDGIS